MGNLDGIGWARVTCSALLLEAAGQAFSLCFSARKIMIAPDP